MDEDRLIVPEGKATGCLLRATKFGSCSRLLTDEIKVIPRDKWEAEIGKVNLRNRVNQIIDQNGYGCHDDKTEVLTEKGWRQWTDYDGSTALGTVNPITRALEFQLPTELHSYDYDGPLYVIDHRSMNFALTPNHRMFVRPWNERKRTLDDFYVIRNVDNLGWYNGLLASPSGFVGTEIGTVRIGEQTYIGDDFIALVSLVASDGWAGGSESTKHRVSFCCFREDRMAMVRALAARLGFREQSNRHGVWEQRNPGLASWMRANLFTGNTPRSPYKRVPSFVKCVGTRQVKLFFEFYGDQHVAGKQRAFYTSSRQMADDLQELLLRIGKRSGICIHKPRDTRMRDGRRIMAANCATPYTVGEWSEDNLSIERRRGLEQEHYKGGVFCATVPNSLLVTRRNNKILISGNSCATCATAQAAMICRDAAGLPFVFLNPLSIYRITSGGRDSGSSIDENLVQARTVGILPESYWPYSKGFRATPPDGWEEVAKDYKCDEFFDCGSVDEVGTALLIGFPVVFGWSGHSCVLTRLLSSTTAEYANSWGDWGDEGFGKIKLSSINFGYGAWALRSVIESGGKDIPEIE